MSAEQDEFVADEFPPRIEPGIYEAVCSKVETGISYGAERKLFVRFKIHGGEYHGTELFMVCRYPKGEKISHRYKLYQQWALALGRRPRKKERFSMHLFKGKLYRVSVKDTQRKLSNNALVPDYLQYSVVETIIETLVGTSYDERV